MDKKKMKMETIRRMKALELYDSPEASTIRAFMEDGILYASHPVMGNRAAALYKLTEAEKNMVKNFEDRHGTIVYHVIKNEMIANIASPMVYSTVYSLLYASEKEEEWEEECNGFDNFSETYIASPKVYVWNAGKAEREIQDLLSGSGSFCTITITAGSGGVCRLA